MCCRRVGYLAADWTKEKDVGQHCTHYILSNRRTVIDVGKFPVMSKLKLVVPISVMEGGSSEIDLLIGNDYYYEFVKPERIQIDDGLVALSTEFGWLLTGRVETLKSGLEHIFLALGMSNKYADETFSLETFWRLESIGIRDPSNISDDDIALTNFNDTIQLEGQRYFIT